MLASSTTVVGSFGLVFFVATESERSARALGFGVEHTVLRQ